MTKREKLAYMAGRLEERGKLENLSNDRFRISLRTHDHLPKSLKREFGGTCFKHKGSLWYRVQGENAAAFLRTLFPYLVLWKERAEKLLSIEN